LGGLSRQPFRDTTNNLNHHRMKPNNLTQQLATYGCAAAALGAAKEAEAVLVVKDLGDAVISASSNFSIDPFADGALDFTLNSLGSSTTGDHFFVNPDFGDTTVGGVSANGIDFTILASGPANYAVKHLPVGSSVSAANVGGGFNFRTYPAGYYVKNNGVLQDNWGDGQSGYAAFRIQLSGRTHYGWLEWTPNGGTSDQATLHRFAIETGDGVAAPITTPQPPPTQVPDGGPSALLLAAGASGLAALRRRRQDAA